MSPKPTVMAVPTCRGLAAALMLLVTTSAASACQSETAPRRYPIGLSADGRHLADAADRPFLLHGDTAWSLIADLTREEADLYLRDRQRRGFNTILVNLLEHRFTRNAPANAYSEPPFLVPGDYATPNPAYFDHAEWVLRRACDLGFLVLLAPSYLGNMGSEEGWYAEMEASGAAKLRDFGRGLGSRFGALQNIIWLQAGDYDPPDKEIVRELALGIRETDRDALQTAHGAPGSAALNYWAGEPWLALNTVYTYGPVWEAARGERARDPAMPFFMLESAYENEHGAGAYRVRMQAYQALLSGAVGHVYGNNPIWHFAGPGLFPVDEDWKAQLDSPGARSMQVLIDIMTSVEWWRLEPDLTKRLMTDGAGTHRARSVAAFAADGSFAMVYAATSWPFTLDLAQLRGPLIEARWRDPVSGAVQPAEASPLAPGKVTFRPARRNIFGENDWVLELRSVESGGGDHES